MKRLQGIGLVLATLAGAFLLAAAQEKKAALTLRWYGQSFFLLSSSSGTRVAIDPFGKETGYKLPQVAADVVTVSHSHADHNNVALIQARGGKKPRVFEGTKNGMKDWEYVPRTKVGDVDLYSVGVYHDNVQGKKIGKNAAFVYEVDGLRLVHLGDLGHQLEPDQVQKIGRVDVVMVPVGGTYTIDAAGADRVLAQLAPKLIIIPMHYKTPALAIPLQGVEPFLKGKDNVKKVDSIHLTLRQEDLPAKPEILVLRYE